MIDKKSNGFHYLERYQAGQYKEVWNELVQLGPAVFEDQLYVEALEVARSMMRRVRTNIETLIVRLSQRGFVFGYDVRLQEQLAHSLTSAHDRRRYIEMIDWVHEQPPTFLLAQHKQLEEEIALTQQLLEQDPSLAVFCSEEIRKEEKAQLRQTVVYADVLEQMVGPVPLAVRAWFEEFEAVNFFGYHPQWGKLISSFPGETSDCSLMSSCDPFQICIPDEQKMGWLKEDYQLNKVCDFEFAPDRYFKDYYGGSSTPYAFFLPQASMDAIMPGSGSTTFVEYIRVSLEWAGFPGMMQWPDVPRDDLAFLTNNLLPF